MSKLTVASKDGTTIAFETASTGPAVIGFERKPARDAKESACARTTFRYVFTDLPIDRSQGA